MAAYMCGFVSESILIWVLGGGLEVLWALSYCSKKKHLQLVSEFNLQKSQTYGAMLMLKAVGKLMRLKNERNES